MTTQATAADAVQHMVADEVRAEMARQRKTAADLASAIGTTQHTVGRRLNGSTPFNVAEVASIAELFGTTADALIRAALSHETKKAVA